MKKIVKRPGSIEALALFLGFFMLASASALGAGPTLSDASRLVGKWTLDYTAPRLDEPRKRKARQSWEFRPNGKLVSVADDPRAKDTFSVTVNYEIKDGKIIADQAGRPGKKVTYVVVELSDRKLILKGGLDGYMFFSRK